MKRFFTLLLAVLWIIAGLAASAEDYHIDAANAVPFAALLNDLLTAYEAPSEGDGQKIDADVEAICAVSESDGEIARRIADHWRMVYLDDSYPLYIYDGGVYATSLEQALPDDPGALAIVTLGYELKDGAMTEELMGRCEAAAAVARSYPAAIIVCSGGATGPNNPEGHTEAGLMKDYLVDRCGIDAARIFIDERAMTTVENALNTFGIMEEQGIEAMIIVTSTYHQKWGQAIYNAVGALYEKSHDYAAELLGNYCFDIEPSNETFRNDAKIAVQQLATVLELP